MKQEGYDLMGAAFEDYSVLGYGMAEEIYQQSFEIGAAGYPKPRHAPPRESSILTTPKTGPACKPISKAISTKACWPKAEEGN